MASSFCIHHRKAFRMSTASAPLEISRVALTVHDLPAVADFYRRTLGLADLSKSSNRVALGAGDRVLLELIADPAARRASPREAGLFHTAFLMPSRPALARWLIHAANSGVQLQGASDHLVSEAIYLADPEGNGIEVYVDRPRDRWHGPDGKIKMATERLDLNALARDADAPWSGAPEGMAIGHVHLQVGAIPEAEAFYAGLLGLKVMAHYPGANFYGSGGYHHHIATNVWNSRGAGPREQPSTGLAELVLAVDAAEQAAIHGHGGSDLMQDPWGTAITLEPKAA
jgi:catechol 2,3-dioxygenase